MFGANFKLNRKMLGALLAAGIVFCAGSQETQAGVVQPSGLRDKTDRVAIQKEIDETGQVKLVPGKEYYLLGTLYAADNLQFDATGATVITNNGAIRNIPEKPAYGSLNNVTIIGGTWKNKSEEGYNSSSFQFTQAQNLTMKDMDILCTNYQGHGIELIACKNVVIEGCNVIGQGSPVAESREEMVQLDTAGTGNAPQWMDKSVLDGSTCKNVELSNCTIVGGRGLCANKNSTYINKYHDKITLKKCNITGMTTEAVVLYNTRNCTVDGCVLDTRTNNKTANYSTGLHISAACKAKLGKIVIKNNTIKGWKQSVLIWSDNGKYKYQRATITGNKLYASKKKKTLTIYATKKTVKKKNKNYKNK